MKTVISIETKKDYAAQRGRDACGTATRIRAWLFRRLSAFFESTSRPRPKSGKVRRSDTRPGDVRERAARVEGNDSAPTQNATYFGVCALVCDFSRRAECVQAATSAEAKKITQPSGAATPRNSDAHKRIAVPKALRVPLEHPRPRPKSGKVRRSDTRPGDVCERAERSEGSDSGPVRKAPVSACKPLCAILLAKASVYPLSLVKANVGRLCEKLKIGMKDGLR